MLREVLLGNQKLKVGADPLSQTGIRLYSEHPDAKRVLLPVSFQLDLLTESETSGRTLLNLPS